jgi:hypothetical protein
MLPPRVRAHPAARRLPGPLIRPSRAGTGSYTVQMGKQPPGRTTLGTQWHERVRFASGCWLRVESVVAEVDEPHRLGMDFSSSSLVRPPPPPPRAGRHDRSGPVASSVVTRNTG